METNYISRFKDFSFLIYKVAIREEQMKLLLNSGVTKSKSGVLNLNACYHSYQKYPLLFGNGSLMAQEIHKLLDSMDATVIFEENSRDYEAINWYTQVLCNYLQEGKKLLKGNPLSEFQSACASIHVYNQWIQECRMTAYPNTLLFEGIDYSFQKVKQNDMKSKKNMIR